MRKIWLTRHGESMYNTLHRLGGDSPLSPRGEVYSKKLPDVLVDRVPLVRDAHRPMPLVCRAARRGHQASYMLSVVRRGLVLVAMWVSNVTHTARCAWV